MMTRGYSLEYHLTENSMCGDLEDCGVDNYVAGTRYAYNIKDCKDNCSANESCGGFFMWLDGACYLRKSTTCGRYEKKGIDCYEKQTTESALASGDPHFVTWWGRKFDFHGICDLLLLQNPGFEQGVGLHIHVRTKQIKQFSFISTAVLQIGNDSLEVTGDIHENLFWINKRVSKKTDEGIVGKINGYGIKYHKVHLKQHEFFIDLGDASITMKTYKSFVHVGINNAAKYMFGSSSGLLGAYGTGALISRDGNKIFDDIEEFGQEWQVSQEDGDLFHNIEGPQAPSRCEIPLASNIRRRLAQSSITEEEAKLTCVHVNADVFEMCVFDVMATGDNDVVGVY